MNFKYIPLIITTIVALISCDNISEEKRVTKADTSSFKKPVVVIDFTGVMCSNCPNAAKLLAKMHNTAGDKIIGVAMYPDCSFNHAEFDLRSTEATEYYKYFGDLSKIVLPSGAVDFAPYESKIILDADLWSSAVTKRITRKCPVEISLEATLDKDQKEITINIKASTTEAISNTSLILWLLEDDIIGTQNVSGTIINNYQHNHVLRSAINGLWGESVSMTPSATFNKTIKYKTNNSEWKLENCSVVAVLINSNTKEILTANKIEF